MIVDGVTLRVSSSEFLNIIDNAYDEIIVYDNNYNIVYINKASRRHYGLEQKEMINKSFHEFIGKQYWNNSVLPKVYKTRKTVAALQTTMLDVKIRTIATPIFDRHNNLSYVVMSVRDDLQGSFYPEDVRTKKIEFDDDYITTSGSMNHIFSSIKRVSEGNIICTLHGERGTGKKNIAKYIHNNSQQARNGFHIVNVANITHDNFDEIFFGHSTESKDTKNSDGLLKTFEDGTLFFDDIGILPLNVQSKLAYLIQEQEYYEIGSNNVSKLNCRFIFSTTSDLYQLTQSEKFRKDLYYLISVVEINILPLRERKDDLKKYIYFYLNHFSKKHQVNCQICDETYDIMMKYPWNGNINEVMHVVEKLVLSSTDVNIMPKDLPKMFFDINNSSCKHSFSYKNKGYYDYMEDFEKELFIDAFHKFKTTRAIADNLGISQTKASKGVRKYIYEE